MYMILDKCIFRNRSSLRQFQCAPTTYVNSINECFSPLTFLSQFSQLFFMFQCNEHVKLNRFLCSLACTWMTIIYSQFHVTDS